MSLNTPYNRQPRAPLHLCALTLNRHRDPVAAPDGTVFDASTIRQLVRRTGLNPITGQPLSPNALIHVSISTDPRTSLPRCPILFHPFNQDIKIVAIATSGNVYSFAAVQRLNLQCRNMTDLIDRTPFTLDDIIVLFDPQKHVWSTHPQERPPSSPPSPQSQRFRPHPPSPPLTVSNHPPQPLSMEPVRYRLSHPEAPHHCQHQYPKATQQPETTPNHSLSPPPHFPNAPKTLPMVDSVMQHQQQHFLPSLSPRAHQSTHLLSSSSQPIHSSQLPIRMHASASIHPQAYPPTSSPCTAFTKYNQTNTKRSVEKCLQPSQTPKKPRLHADVLPTTPQPPDRPVTKQKTSASAYFDRKRAEEERKSVYRRIRKGRKGKGYVRVVTNIGHLNIELHCDKVPTTCDNFLSLAETKYYNGLRWHRVIPGFIAQTGDPTGTGKGGDSFWGGYIKDEFRTSLVHDSAGVVSMANSGRDTNLSQWFICLDAAPHLDGSHTVFGKVVGGLFVLKKIESEAEMGHPLTVETIEVLVNPIRQIRDQMKKAKLTQGMPPADSSATTSTSQASSVPNITIRSPGHDQERQGMSGSLAVGTNHPPVHPQAQSSLPYPVQNHPPEVPQENLPPAKTLLSAAEMASRDT